MRYWSRLFHLGLLYLLSWLLYDRRFVTFWLICCIIWLLLLLIIFRRVRGIFSRCRLKWLNIFIRVWLFDLLHRIWIVAGFLLHWNVLATLGGWFLSTHSCTIHLFFQQLQTFLCRNYLTLSHVIFNIIIYSLFWQHSIIRWRIRTFCRLQTLDCWCVWWKFVVLCGI